MELGKGICGMLKRTLCPPVLMHNCSNDAGILRVKTLQKRTADTEVANWTYYTCTQHSVIENATVTAVFHNVTNSQLYYTVVSV